MGSQVVASRAQREKTAQLTRFHQRIAAEALTARGGGGTSRLAPALVHSAVDLNPHQIEAAAFALASLPTGGAVLADEVGLGKTVEAGLVLAHPVRREDVILDEQIADYRRVFPLAL